MKVAILISMMAVAVAVATPVSLDDFNDKCKPVYRGTLVLHGNHQTHGTQVLRSDRYEPFVVKQDKVNHHTKFRFLECEQAKKGEKSYGVLMEESTGDCIYTSTINGTEDEPALIMGKVCAPEDEFAVTREGNEAKVSFVGDGHTEYGGWTSKRAHGYYFDTIRVTKDKDTWVGLEDVEDLA